MNDFSSSPQPDISRDAWSLREGVVYLNHGAFGPSPRVVQHAQQQWRETIEGDPTDFFLRVLAPELRASLEKLGQFIHAPADDCVFLDNATVAMNVVARSLALRPGDEVVITNHVYGAVRRMWEQTCHEHGAQLVVCKVATPINLSDAWCESIMEGVSSRTRLVVFSHVTSPTALVVPVEKLCGLLREREIAICIDGPHAIAMQPLDIKALDCDFYTASCHKWLCAPFGSGFLYAHPRVQSQVRPVVTSWGRPLLDTSYCWRDEFLWQGTRDVSAHLAVTAAIEFMTDIGLQRFREYTHSLASYARERLGELTGLPPLTQDSEECYGSMVAMPLPDGPVEPLREALWKEDRIEVPIIDWEGQRLIRVSCHMYTTSEEIDRLIDALSRLLFAK